MINILFLIQGYYSERKYSSSLSTSAWLLPKMWNESPDDRDEESKGETSSPMDSSWTVSSVGACKFVGVTGSADTLDSICIAETERPGLWDELPVEDAKLMLSNDV